MVNQYPRDRVQSVLTLTQMDSDYGGVEGLGNVAPGNKWRTAYRACDRARQREGRLGQVNDRDAYRGVAAQGRAARRHHRSRQPAEDLHALHRESSQLR